MNKTTDMVFRTCTVDGDKLIEHVSKDEVLYHDIMGIFQELDGEEGLTITIKKMVKSGEIHASNK